jgi:hypothetical protein
MMAVEGFSFQPPAGFRTEEVTIALRMPLAAGPSPSLIVSSRPTAPGARLPELAAQTFAELAGNGVRIFCGGVKARDSRQLEG